MKLRTVAASIAIGLASIGCSTKKAPNLSEKPNRNVESTSTVENIPPISIKEKGSLEDAEWEIIYQKEQVSVYKVKYKNKNITVIGDWHMSLGIKAVLEVLEEVKKDPKSWCLLIEKSEQVSKAAPEIEGSNWNVKDLPGAGEGMDYLIDSKQVSKEDIITLNAMLVLDRIARDIELTPEQKENPLKWTCSVLSDEELSEEELRELVLSATSTPEKLAHAADEANRLILDLAVYVSDKMITDIINEALDEDYDNYLIHMGEGHLRSLVRSGPIADYCKNLLIKLKTDPKLVQMSLDASKNK